MEYSFQADSNEIKECFKRESNYLIDYSDSFNKEYCIIYFSSNDIYFPNNSLAFNETIVKRNKFEWVNNKIAFGYKHIFLRDIKKQWYLNGINETINSPEKLVSFLLQETNGFKVITVGSSAGGFAAVLYGSLIGANRVYSFNGQFNLNIILPKVDEKTNPILFRNKDNPKLISYYDLNKYINSSVHVFYFQSILSQMDVEQYETLNEINKNKIFRIKFKNSNHGFPFFRFNLKFVFTLAESELINLTKSEISPIQFSIRSIGILRTFYLYFYLALNYLLKLTKRSLLRFIK